MTVEPDLPFMAYAPEPELIPYDDDVNWTGLFDRYGRKITRQPEPVGFVPAGFRAKGTNA
ncbi:putative phage-related DNA-binding protein [Roseibium sp. TrichSKD4]|uniref:hypothetical protein n=1 Tax=Roseibium sp. TrichSKD4 TaxID=744980 RepID=UPI0001E5693F|nr:hypothetical protein [Roseibium sp. TrichSKD4]EFO32479.1 putative phage-related DNA-binding protein [Roseibium sp. TrichSKD4]